MMNQAIAILMLNTALQDEGPSQMDQISSAFVQAGPDWAAARGWLFLVGVVIILAGVALLGVRLKFKDDKRFGPCVRGLAQQAELSHRQRLWLNHVARSQGFINASGMILSCGTFDHVTQAYLAATPRPAKAQRHLATIRQQVHAA